MFGLTATFRAAAAVAGVVGIAALLPSTNEWPATDEFDGRVYANTETGCLAIPPDDWRPAHIIRVAPEPAARADATNRTGMRGPLEEPRGPGLQRDAYVHAEPWPACDNPQGVAPARTHTGADR